MVLTDFLYRLRDVYFQYGTDWPVLSGVNLDLRAGERVGLLGANGSGKSTLLRLMVGLLRPTRGSIEAFGTERREEQDFFEVRARAGLLFQDADDQLFCPTVIEDVAFGPRNLGCGVEEATSRARETLEGLELASLADRVTHHLSGGEKRMVSVATVLAMRPEILLLDEPTAGLDEKTRARLVAKLNGLSQAILVVSHDREFLESLACDLRFLQDGSFST